MDLRVCERCSRVQPAGTICPGCSGPLALADASFFLGKEFGKYRVERLLGAGGMGVVFAARHALLQRPAAIKVIQPAGADENFLKRFLREAQVLAELKHPNIVEVYDFEVSPWGPPYYIMEYLEGSTLRDVVNRRGRDLDLADFAPLLRELCAALSFAHGKGVVHRDLKPENIFVAIFGARAVAKVLDFGIAKLLSEGPGDTALTASGAVMGTPNYLAPEQIMMQPVGPATDQYALALVVAELVSGKAVRAGKSLGEICSVEIRKPLPLEWPSRPDLSEAVRKALHRATQPDPQARFPSVSAFLDALELPPGEEGLSRLAEAATVPSGDETSVLTPTGRRPRPSAPLPPTLLTPPQHAPSAGSLPPTQMTPVTRQDQPARPERPLPRRRWIAGVVALVALAAVSGVVWRFLPQKSPGAASDKGTAAVLREFEEIGNTALPPDAQAVVGFNPDQRVTLALGPGCVYLLKEGAPPARIQLEQGTEVLGSLPSGNLVVKQGAAFLRRDFIEGKSEELLRPLPQAERFAATPSGRGLVAFSGGSMTFRALESGAASTATPVKLGQTPVRWALGERRIVIQAGGEMIGCDLVRGEILWRIPLPDAGVRVLALDEGGGLVAAAGQFDKVIIFGLEDGKPRATLSRQRWTAGMAFLPQGSCLLVSGDGGLSRWQPGQTELAPVAGVAEDSFASLRFTGRHLLVEDARANSVRSFAVRLAGAMTFPCAQREVWALAASPDGKGLFVGSADGSLQSLDPLTGTKTAHPLHTQGVTALVAAGQNLASSSDDKTITIWGLPGMTVQWRSRAHDFLINGLCLAGSPPVLWSSSSDGSVKRWAWPGLEVQESVEMEPLLGKRYILAALWASEGGDRLLVGSWNGALLDLAKEPKGTWGGRALKVPNECLYSAAAVPSAQVVLFGGLGGSGSALYAYDLKQSRLLRLDDLGAPLSDAIVAALPGSGEACAGGAGTVLHYTFSRDAAGKLRYEIRCAVNTDLGFTLAVAPLPQTGLLALGDEEGKVHLLKLQELRALPACARVAE